MLTMLGRCCHRHLIFIHLLLLCCISVAVMVFSALLAPAAFFSIFCSAYALGARDDSGEHDLKAAMPVRV